MNQDPEDACPEPDPAIVERLHSDVHQLAGEIGERNVWRPAALAAAADYIETRLARSGGRVRCEHYQAEGQMVRNIEAEFRGTEDPDCILVIGAHYDTRCGMQHSRSTVRMDGVPGTPGANDNASAVAGLLEIARTLAGRAWPVTVRVVAFANEEHPFFQTHLMGSRVYAGACRQRHDNIAGMIALDDIGYFTDQPGTQKYFFPYNLFYPSTGSFLAFLTSFRQCSDFPALGCVVPAVIPRIGWSDDWAFWQEGYRAMALTDTAFLRYPHYHTMEDTPDKLDYSKMAAIVSGLTAALPGLVARCREQP